MIHRIEQYAIDIATKLRKKHYYTQVDWAKIIKTTSSFVGNVENTRHAAKYNLKHIHLLADHFGISPRDFLPDVPIDEKIGIVNGHA